jgi:hypothetical protein
VGRVCVPGKSPSAQAEEYEQIEEVHATQDEDDQADLEAKHFNHALGGMDGIEYPERGDSISNVDQIEPDQKQSVHAAGKQFIAMKYVEEKYLAVGEQSMRYPYSKHDGDGQVQRVRKQYVVHGSIWLCVTIYSIQNFQSCMKLMDKFFYNFISSL